VIGFLTEGGAPPPPTRNNFGDTMSDGMAGPLALLIIVLLAIATVLLIRNMNARLRRLPERFPDEPAPPPSRSRRRTASGGTSAGAAAPVAEPEPDPDPTGRSVPSGPATPPGS
jgi:hypothetical protein